MGAWYIRGMPFPQIELSKDASVDEQLAGEIAEFEKFFISELKNEPLVRSESAILKTYLFWKTREKK